MGGATPLEATTTDYDIQWQEACGQLKTILGSVMESRPGDPEGVEGLRTRFDRVSAHPLKDAKGNVFPTQEIALPDSMEMRKSIQWLIDKLGVHGEGWDAEDWAKFIQSGRESSGKNNGIPARIFEHETSIKGLRFIDTQVYDNNALQFDGTHQEGINHQYNLKFNLDTV